MSEIEILVYSTIAIALFFDFVNGFHDSSNSIATVVGTEVLKPLQAVGMAALANVAGPFIFGTAVAQTVGKDIIQPEFSTVFVIFSALIGAITWNLITWYLGLPSSGLAAGGLKALFSVGIQKTVIFMVLSPILGFIVAYILTIGIMYFLGHSRLSKVNSVFGRLQIASSAFLSLTHGANDGQKTVGVITALLIAGHILHSFVVPVPVIIAAASAMRLGTFFGGWRIVKTVAFKLTPLRPYQGFSTETGGGAILTLMATFGIPVSTTHSISGAVMGTGASKSSIYVFINRN